MPLARFTDARIRYRIARRVLLSLKPPMAILAAASRLIGRGRRANTWYGLLFDYCFWRGVAHAVPNADTWLRLTTGTPILMYHAFGGRDEAPRRFIVSVRRFARQMRLLKRHRYQVLKLDEWLEYRRAYRLPPPRSVVITVDDGYADMLELASPVLCGYGLSSTLFVVSGTLGAANDWDRSGELRGRQLLSRPELVQLARSGVAIGAHSRSHTRLTTFTREQLCVEIGGSRAELERELGTTVRAFAYPYGASSPACEDVARATGFWGACGIEPGLNSPGRSDFDLRRTEIRGSDSLLRFALAVWLGDGLRERRV
jgi:peptidoglycan/xylan/chitin deacetylase (PgdA/CDA1 family)